MVSNVKGGWEASVGYDPITGNELSHFDRSVSGAGIVFGGFARVPGKMVKYGSEGAKYVLRVNKAEKTVTKRCFQGRVASRKLWRKWKSLVISRLFLRVRVILYNILLIEYKGLR
ncbi:MAG: pre-toxin TG domain-containing protein, partial [Priestia megaterium]